MQDAAQSERLAKAVGVAVGPTRSPPERSQSRKSSSNGSFGSSSSTEDDTSDARPASGGNAMQVDGGPPGDFTGGYRIAGGRGRSQTRRRSPRRAVSPPRTVTHQVRPGPGAQGREVAIREALRETCAPSP